jgi:hypothetical protein
MGSAAWELGSACRKHTQTAKLVIVFLMMYVFIAPAYGPRIHLTSER